MPRAYRYTCRETFSQQDARELEDRAAYIVLDSLRGVWSVPRTPLERMREMLRELEGVETPHSEEVYESRGFKLLAKIARSRRLMREKDEES